MSENAKVEMGERDLINIKNWFCCIFTNPALNLYNLRIHRIANSQPNCCRIVVQKFSAISEHFSKCEENCRNMPFSSQSRTFVET